MDAATNELVKIGNNFNFHQQENKLLYVPTWDSYTEGKMNELDLYVSTWMNLAKGTINKVGEK
jgi:hypothetical protein